MSIVKFKDFVIKNITDTVHEVHEFHGTFADNRTNICEILIEISTEVDNREVELKMTIKPQEIGAFGSYGDDRDKGFGISTEVFTDLISHALNGADSLSLQDFVRHYFEKFGYTHSVELRYGKRAYLGYKDLYLTTEGDIKSVPSVSLSEVLTRDIDWSSSAYKVIQFTLEDLTTDLVENLVQGFELSRLRQRDYEKVLKDLPYAKEYLDRQYSYIYYLSALVLLLRLKSKHPWGILPLELVCEDNLVRGEIKRLLPTSIKKMEQDNLVYSLEDLLRGVK